MHNVALLSLTGGAPTSLDGVPTHNQLRSGTILEVLSGSVADENLTTSRWVLVAGVNETDCLKYVRPLDFNVLVNARVWVRIP